jgi:hypoxanthine phosphoribosyltransferase
MDDKIHLSWDATSDLSLKLADLIKQSSQSFDYMVVVPRGGYFVANIVARELNIEPTQLLHACVGSYDAGAGNQRAELAVGEMPATEKVSGKKLLIIDEVCDSGETLAFVVDYLKQAGATDIKSGVLHYKPANSRSGYAPDWAVEETVSWIVYPWEEREFQAASLNVN